MESWRKVFREGLVPLLSTQCLEILKKALEKDDSRLIQSGTTVPPPIHCVEDWPVEAACAIGFCGWQGEGLITVGEVEMYFAKICYEVDQRISEPAAIKWFLNFWDETPRKEVFKLVLEEINLQFTKNDLQ